MRKESTRKKRVKDYLRTFCKGRANAKRSKDLERELHISGTDLRDLVSELRQDKFPIASGPEGYFYAENAAELYDSIDWLKAMVRGLEASIHGMVASLGGYREGDE